MERRIFLMVAAGAALAPGLAMAGEATQQEVSLSAEVAAPPDEVWQTIGDFQDMSWHPVVHSTTGANGSDIGATRVLTLAAQDGPTIAEVLDAYDAGKMSYSYRITDVAMEVLPVTEYVSQLGVQARVGGGSLIEWRGAFRRADASNDPPAGLDDAAAIAAITGVYQAGLDALVEKFGVPPGN